MKKVLFFFFPIIFVTLNLQGQEGIDQSDSVAVSPKGAGEIYLSLGYSSAIRSVSSYQPNAFTVGAGVEMLPGSWVIGVGTRFSYLNQTDKFFRNLHYPHLHVYGLYRAYNTDKGQIFAGLAAELLTSVFYEEIVMQQEHGSFHQKSGFQNFLCLGFRGMYKYPFLIGKKKNSKLVLSSFVELSLPVYAFSTDSPTDETRVSYNDWLFRFGAHVGVRVGFGK